MTSMPSDKAPGIDKISMRVNKHSPPAILSSVTSIINESLASNTFPKEWKPAEVIPVLKEVDHEKPNNYRPISLLPVLSKLCECIALNQLVPYLVENDRLSVHQSGDKKWHSVQWSTLLIAFSQLTKRKHQQWFRRYSSNRYQAVRINTALSEPLLMRSGVPQGSILGPLLFIVYANDLPSIPQHRSTDC